MSKKIKNDDREKYDIEDLLKYIKKNSTQQDPYSYSEDKMAIFGTNINLKRFICDIKDGLKPVHRRILFAMYENKLFPGTRSKSAQVVGDVLKKYHAHGDSSAYSSLVYLGQSWRNNITLVDTKTNFGSAYCPDGYAHYRYTDCGLSEFAYDCFFKDWKLTNPREDMTVDWMDNYDESRLEPMYLPAKYPLFLLNWHSALGLGRSTMTFGFNLTEAFNAVMRLIDDPDAEFVIYPDDPKGCEIINKKDLKNILDDYSTKLKVRSTYRIQNDDGGGSSIIIENVPFEVAPITVQESIEKLAHKGDLPEIYDLAGQSEFPGTKFKIIIKVKKGYDPVTVMEKLYKKTQLETTFVSRYSYVNGLQSVDYTLRVAILEWLRYRRQTIIRMYKIKLLYALKRIHFLRPLIKVIKSGEIDEFIKIVRNNDEYDAIIKLMKKFDLTDYQAEKIIDVKISALSQDKLVSYEKELHDLEDDEKNLSDILTSKHRIDDIIKSELTEGIKKYGYDRKSKVSQLSDEPIIAETDHYLIFTRRYIKKLPYDDRGYRVGRLDNNEKIVRVMQANNLDKILIFTEDGRCTPVNVYDIGNSSLQSVGISYEQIGVKSGQFVDAIKISDDIMTKYILSVTKNGQIIKTPYVDIDDKKKSFVYMKIDKNDSLSGVGICSDNDRIIVYTSKGNAAIFSFNDFETTSIGTKGVQSAKTDDDEYISGVKSFSNDDEMMIVLTDRGYVKKFPIKSMPSTKRAGKCIEINNSHGDIVGIKAISDDCMLFIYTSFGAVEIDSSTIKSVSRIGRNERIVELKSSEYAFYLE